MLAAFIWIDRILCIDFRISADIRILIFLFAKMMRRFT